jgi:hypothetical protein
MKDDEYTGFTGIRPIPKKIEIIGDKDKGINYVGVAESQLKILENDMALGEQTIGIRTVNIDNFIVEAWKTLDMCGVRITIRGAGEEKKQREKCFCTCHVAIGYVQNHRHACYDYTDLWKTYDVIVCNKEDHYILIKNVMPMGFTTFRNGEKVLVVFEPDTGEEYIPNIKQGCNMIHCRITTVRETHNKFYIDLTQ